MARISIENLEKMMQTKYVCTETIRVKDKLLGDTLSHDLDFDIFDGMAYCHYNNADYRFIFPKKSLIKEADNFDKNIREIMGLSDTDEIKETDILSVYGSLSKF